MRRSTNIFKIKALCEIINSNKIIFTVLKNTTPNFYYPIKYGISAFQSIRILRLSKLLRFIRIFRSVSLILKFRKYMDKFLKTNNFIYIIWITLSVLLIGTIGIHFAEGLSFGNALRWCFVTISTVGYGNISPTTTIGRIIAAVTMITGIGFLGMLTATMATFFLKKSDSTGYKGQTIEDIKTRLDNFDDLSIEDINNIHNVLIALKKYIF